MIERFWSAPKPGDIVQCRFPERALGKPGPKERPALVIGVKTYPDGSVDVEVAYGTSQGTTDVHAGELVLEKSDPAAGLQKDTKFDLRNIARLPFNDEWFAPDPARRFGEHPKRGTLDLGNVQNKRKLQAAVAEIKGAHNDPTSSRRRI